MRRYDTPDEVTVCVCPRCGVKHTRQIWWVGRGVPKYYCKSCKLIRGSLAFQEDSKEFGGRAKFPGFN